MVLVGDATSAISGRSEAAEIDRSIVRFGSACFRSFIPASVTRCAEAETESLSRLQMDQSGVGDRRVL